MRNLDLLPIHEIMDFQLRHCACSACAGFDCFPTIPIKSSSWKTPEFVSQSAYRAGLVPLALLALIWRPRGRSSAICWIACNLIVTFTEENHDPRRPFRCNLSKCHSGETL